MNTRMHSHEIRKIRNTPTLHLFNQVPDIVSIGKKILDPVWAREMHRSNPNELMHVMRGDVTVKYGKRRIEAHPGDTLIVPAGTLHRDEFDFSVGLEVFYVFFDWPPSKEFFKIAPLKDIARFCAPMTAEISKLCDRMQIGLDAGTEPDQLLICSHTHTILLLILREALRARAPKDHDSHLHHGQALLIKAKEYIDQHFTEQISLDQIAADLHISSFYLSHLFSRENDFSFVEYITQVRMRKAKELLSSGAKNVAEAAYAVGYNDSSYFSKVFHRYFGASPHAVRCRPPEHPVGKTAK